MAFVEVTNSNFLKAKDIAIGKSITGYLVGAVENRKFAGKWDLIMGDNDGETVYTLLTAGNLAYIAKDVSDGKKLHYAGKMVRITRGEDRLNKMKQVTSSFRVEIDSDNIMPSKWIVLSPQLNGSAPAAATSSGQGDDDSGSSSPASGGGFTPPSGGGFRPGGMNSAPVTQAPVTAASNFQQAVQTTTVAPAQTTTAQTPAVDVGSMSGDQFKNMFANRFPGAQ